MSKHNCICILFIRLTTCFGHCGPSSGHKDIYNEKIYSIRTLVVVPILTYDITYNMYIYFTFYPLYLSNILLVSI